MQNLLFKCHNLELENMHFTPTVAVHAGIQFLVIFVSICLPIARFDAYKELQCLIKWTNVTARQHQQVVGMRVKSWQSIDTLV